MLIVNLGVYKNCMPILCNNYMVVTPYPVEAVIQTPQFFTPKI